MRGEARLGNGSVITFSGDDECLGSMMDDSGIVGFVRSLGFRQIGAYQFHFLMTKRVTEIYLNALRPSVSMRKAEKRRRHEARLKARRK